MDKAGRLVHGWVMETGKVPLPGYIVCGREHLKWAKRRILQDLAEKPCLARFIDTTTAAPLYEC